MDLGAYANIDDLEQIAKDNRIVIPRLRGYRLMQHEKPVSQKDINQMKIEVAIETAENLCEAVPFWSANPKYCESGYYTDHIKNHFLIKDETDEYTKYIGICWDRIHGWKRKVLKFEIKKQQRKVQQQYNLWNKYAGKENVLYIHSRMGGNNWDAYDKKIELMHQPWFLDRVDDCYDSTYCDFYAKIN